MIGRFLIGDGSNVLHFVVGRKREIESYGVVIRDSFSEKEADVSYFLRVFNVDVVDSVSALEVGNDGLTGDHESERKGHLYD